MPEKLQFENVYSSSLFGLAITICFCLSAPLYSMLPSMSHVGSSEPITVIDVTGTLFLSIQKPFSSLSNVYCFNTSKEAV